MSSNYRYCTYCTLETLISYYEISYQAQEVYMHCSLLIHFALLQTTHDIHLYERGTGLKFCEFGLSANTSLIHNSSKNIGE